MEQGDALAPALFCYGLRRALARAQQRLDAVIEEMEGQQAVHILAYLDDIVLIAPPELVELALEVLTEELRVNCDLELTRRKLQVWRPDGGEPPVSLREWWKPLGMISWGGPSTPRKKLPCPTRRYLHWLAL